MTEQANQDPQAQPTIEEIYRQKVGPVPQEVVDFYGEEVVTDIEHTTLAYEYLSASAQRPNPFTVGIELITSFPGIPQNDREIIEQVAYRGATTPLENTRSMNSLADGRLLGWAMDIKDGHGTVVIHSFDEISNTAKLIAKDLSVEFDYDAAKLVDRDQKLRKCAAAVTDIRPLQLASAGLKLARAYTEDLADVEHTERKSALDLITGRDPSKNARMPRQLARKLNEIAHVQTVIDALETMCADACKVGELAYNDLMLMAQDHALYVAHTLVIKLAGLKTQLNQAEVDDRTAFVLEDYLSTRADIAIQGATSIFENAFTSEVPAANVQLLSNRPHAERQEQETVKQQEEEIKLLDGRLIDARDILLGGRRLGPKKTRKQVEKTADSLKALTSPKDAKATLFTTEECGIVMSVILDKFFDFLELQTVDFDNDPAAKAVAPNRFQTILELKNFDLLTALDNIRQVIGETLSVQKLYGILTDQQIQKLKDILIDQTEQAAS